MPDSPLTALIEAWEASAQQIGQRTLYGDPAASIATVNTLRSCAVALRALAALATPDPTPTLDADRLRQAVVNVREMDPLDYLDDGDESDAIAAEYARLGGPPDA